MLQFEVITLFPDMFPGVLEASLLGKAQERGLLAVRVHDLRPFGDGRHQTTDDYPYGGGAGMVMKIAPLVRCLESLPRVEGESRTVLLTPQGRLLSPQVARELAALDRLVLVCGRYEGIDERFEGWVDDRISIGDYVLTGGELGAMVVVDAVSRFIPEVLGNADSPAAESFEGGVLEYPQYTRPAEFQGHAVPAVLLTGDHERVRRWRRWQSLDRTRTRRPDLFANLDLSAEDRDLLARPPEGPEGDSS